MSDLIIHTGSIIREYMENAGLNQKQLATIMGISPKHLSNILKGNNRITPEMALKLEEAFPQTNVSYWINYDSKYQEQLLRDPRYKELKKLNLPEIAKRFHFKDIFKNTPYSLLEQALQMLDLLGLNSFDEYKPSTQAAKFMKNKTSNPESLDIWFHLAFEEIDIQNDLKNLPDYNAQVFQKEGLLILHDIALNINSKEMIEDCRTILNDYGIGLVFREKLPNSQVRGALTRCNNHPIVMVSGLYKTHDHIWFAIMHELGHLLNGDLEKNGEVVLEVEDENYAESNEEAAASCFAQNFFISNADYLSFCNQNKTEIQSDSKKRDRIIKNAAANFAVDPGILAGRLEHDGILKPNETQHLKTSFSLTSN